MVLRQIFALASLMVLLACQDEAANPPESVIETQTPEVLAVPSRSFRMGFSNFPYALTAEGVAGPYRLIAGHADVYVEQFDEATVPWAAALNGTAFPAAFQERLDRAIENRVSGVPLVLVVMPLSQGRDGIAEPLSGQLPPALAGKPIDEPAYVTAFANYTVRLAEKLNPDYIVTGLEVNDLYINNPAMWPAYRRFNLNLTQELKKRLNGVPLSQSITLHNFFSEAKGDAGHEDAVKELLLEQDFTAVSYYPFLYGAYDDPAAYEDAFDLLQTLTRKPVAFTETGNIAERLVVRQFGVDLPGTETAQARYLSALLRRAQQDDYLFVINWASQDFDALTASLPTPARDLAKIWQDTGLWDEAGRPRHAVEIWDAYQAAPLQ